MSKPNEKSCQIFPEQILSFPSVRPLLFLWKKNLFSNFPKKCRFFFEMKLTVKNFENFLQSISFQKKIDIFSEISKKIKICHKKKGVTGETQQFVQENPK